MDPAEVAGQPGHRPCAREDRPAPATAVGASGCTSTCRSPRWPISWVAVA